MTDKPLDSAGIPDEYWFNLKTMKVEHGKVAAAAYRVGPFTSEDEALNALKTISSRTQKWDEEDD